MKQCNGVCGLLKPIEEFTIGYNKCKECISEYQKQWYQANKKRILESRKEYQETNKDLLREKNKIYYKENKKEINIKTRQYYYDNWEERQIANKIYTQEHQEEILKYQQQYAEQHKEIKQEYDRKYREENKDKINKNKNEYQKERRKKDPKFRNRTSASAAINRLLKSRGLSKNGQSILDYVPWTLDELIIHIEALFLASENLEPNGKPWMTWNNQGKYDPKTFAIDPKWQLDHIIPHSTFHYATMDCQEFRDCWSLSNLRPLSAKQNNIDNCRRNINK